MVRRFFILILMIVCAFCLAWAEPPQAPRLVLEGRVTDSQGAVIPAATVQLLTVGGRAVAHTQADEFGRFRLDGVEPGTYDLRVQYDGFHSRTQRVTVAEGRNLQATVQLDIASVSETVTVTAEAIFAEPNASSATKMNVPLRDIPQSITVLNSELLRSQAVTSMQDAVRNVPGVTVHLGEGRRDQVLIRGFSAVNDQYLNGVRDDAPYYRDLSNVERIEVVKGPAAVLYGRGSSGGIVNRITKEPLTEGTLAELTAVFGSYGTKRASGDLSIPTFDGKLDFRLTGAYEDSGSFRHYFGLNRYDVTPSIYWKPSDRTFLLFQADNLYDSRVPDRGIPSLDGRPAPVAIATYYGYPADDYLRNRVNSQSLKGEHQFAQWTLRNTFRHTGYDNLFSNTQPNGTLLVSGAQQVIRQQYNANSLQQNYFNQTEGLKELRTGPWKHTLLVGGEYGFQSRDFVRFNGTAPNVALFDPILTRPTYNTTTAANDSIFDGTVLASYVQDQIDFGHGWKALAGIRFDYFKQYLNDRRPANVDLTRIDRQWSPRAGIVYQPNPWVSLYGSFSRSFQPSGEGLSLAVNATELKPEITENFELGSKFDFLRGRLSSTVSLFRLNRNNVKTPDPADIARLLPVGLQRTDGFELSFVGRPFSKLEVFGGYALLDATIEKSTTVSSGVSLQGKRAQLVPRHAFNLWSTYSFTNGFGFGGGVVYNDDRFAEANNLVLLPEYTRVDAAVYYRKRHYDIAVNVRNIGNAKYYESAHSNFQIMPGSPVNALVTTRFRW
jgi:catecholate siderophore receptor